MKQHTFIRRSAVASLLALGLCAGTALADGTSTSLRNPGITNPSEQRGLNFNVPGVVSHVHVKEGDVVKTGQLIAEQDDSVDQAELLVKQAEAAGSKLQIAAAEKDLAQKRVELQRSENMFAKGVLGASELDKAKLDVEIGIIRVDLAKQETSQKDLEAAAESAKIAQKKLIATIDGIVQKINVHEGELATNDPKTPCVQIVLNSPLYVEVDLPVMSAKTMTIGQHLYVKYAGESEWLMADVIYFNPVANAAAGTQRVRLQMDNPKGYRSGFQVEVSLEDKKGVADAH